MKMRNTARHAFLLAFLFVLGLPIQANCTKLLNQLSERAQTNFSLSETDSLVELGNELPELIAEIQPQALDFPSFTADFINQQGRAPSLREAFEHAYDFRRDIHQRYDELIAQLESYGGPTYRAFLDEVKESKRKLARFQDLNELQEQIASNPEKYAPITSLDDPIPTFKQDGLILYQEDYYRFIKDRTNLSQYSGEYGELKAMAFLPEPIVRRGLRFDLEENSLLHAHELDLIARLKILESNLEKMTRAELESYLKTHAPEGTGLLRGAYELMHESESSTSDLVARILQALRSKEMDLVSFDPSQNLYVWAEVKTYKRTIDRETLMGGGGKTVYEQLLEHKLLRDLLGLEHQVRMRFISPLSSIDTEARRLLEEIGFEVIDY